MNQEKNVFKIDNEGGIYKAEEINKIQQGREYFHHDQERFFSSEKFDNSKELNDFSSDVKKKEEKEIKHQNTNASSGASGASSAGSAAGAVSGVGATIALPGIVVSLVGAVAIIGVTTGIIPTPPTNHVSVFMSRSTELGFEIDRDPNKSYVMYLYNEENSYSEAVDFIDQVVFTDLLPNTVYNLTVYDTSVDPNVLVYSANYLTASHDDYSSSVTSSGVEDGYLTLNVEYEGENIDFVTIYVIGDDNEIIYTYEGAPVSELTVKVEGYQNVTCQISINGQVTEFEHLVSPGEIIHVQSVNLSEASLELGVGETKTVTATVLPENATNKELIWSSSNNSVATVENGLITALKEGKTTITVKSKDGYKSSSLELTVNKKPPIIHVESISLDETELNMLTGDRATLSATVLPDNAKNKSVTWSSSDESVATVNNRGRVTAVGAGTATITATTVDGGLTATCTVNVTQKIVPVAGVSLNTDELEINVGGTSSLVATVLPTNATNKGVSWNSTDPNVATVSDDGVVTAISAGETIITVTTSDGGYTDFCIIKVQ